MKQPELEEHLDLCAALVVGSIDPSDRKRFAEHLAVGCDPCEQLLPEYERATVMLAAVLPLSAPASALRERVLAAAAGAAPAPASAPSPAPASRERAPATASATPAPNPLPLSIPTGAAHRPGVARRQAFTTPPVTWFALGGALVFVALLAVAVAWHYASQVKHLHTEIASSTEVIAGINQQLQDAQLWGELYTLPDVRTATLFSTARSEVTLRARAIYDARSQRALLVFDGLHPPTGKVYQLWSMEGSRLTNLGVIKTDEQGRAIVRVVQVGDPNRLTAFGVSLEPGDGSTNAVGPLGPLVMVGRVEG